MKTNNKIFIKSKTRRKEEFQFFMHDFIDACKDAGIESKPDIFPSYKFHIRAIVRDLWLLIYSFIHKFLPFLIHRKNKLIVAANGVNIKDNLFPYYFGYDIVPMLWDCWPSTWERMYASFRLLDVKTVLVTSRQVAKMINEETDVKAYWIPEGIKTSLYSKGCNLSERSIDVMEIGRQMKDFHNVLLLMKEKGEINRIINSNINKDGTLDGSHVAYTNEELRMLMADSKIMVCFPQCDTNPQRAGNIETLTQRYWEAMLSRCVLVGRAPQEIIDVIGYNPVIDADWNNITEQIVSILYNITDYQLNVDKNYEVAIKFADWSTRMPMIKKIIER